MRHGVPAPAIAAVAAACIALVAGPGRGAAGEAPVAVTMDTVAAKVGGVAILVREIEAHVNKQIPRTSFHRRVSESKRDVLRREALDKLTIEILAARVGEGRGLDVTAEVDAKIEDIRKSLKSRKEPVDLETALTKSGRTLEGFRAELARPLLALAVEKADVTDKVEVTDEDVRRYYDEHRPLYRRPEAVRLKHFIIKASRSSYAKSIEEARKKAEAAIKEIKTGASFGWVAKRLTGKAPKGQEAGEGLIHRGGLMKSVEEAVFRTEPGEFCPVLKSIYGCHVVKVLEKHPPQDIEFEKVAAAVRKSAEREERERLREAWVAGLREGVEVEVIWSRLSPPAPGAGKADAPKADAMKPGAMNPDTMKEGPHGRTGH